ncbi:MAG: family 16 glycoside hydrolase, partial [Anaerohalosphaeraceae bacterium]
PGKGKIVVLADKVTHNISPLTTGACIEDVNHEVYGGIYSQMIFGESFEEPSLPVPIKGFLYEGQPQKKTAVNYNGSGWQVHEGILSAPASNGVKLIADGVSLVKGQVGVDVYFEDRNSGVAGFIVKVSDSAAGADNFNGYEIALDPQANQLLLGKHRHDWQQLQRVDCPVRIKEWISFQVELDDNRIQIWVDGKKQIDFKDNDAPLTGSQIGLRAWQRTVQFKNLWVDTSNGKQQLPFEHNAQEGQNKQVSGMWEGYQEGDISGTFAIETENTFNGRQSQKMAFQSDTGCIGIANYGLNRRGMDFQKDKEYEGVLWVRAEKPVSLQLSLEDRVGKIIYAKQEISVNQSQWQRVEFKMTSSGQDENGRFCISLTKPGEVVIGYAFLQPGPWGRFKGLPVRLDVAQALIEQGVTILRYGGCMANAPEYRWKKMVGPRDKRPPYKGWWYTYSSNGWGIIDFVDFCEAAGFECVPDFNIEEGPEDMADFVEYIHGGPETTWGQKRIADGHPKPYRIKYIQIGNEETVDAHYLERFKLLAAAIWSRDPEIIPVVGDFAYNEHISDPAQFGGAPRITTLAAQQEILQFAKKHNKPVWFDVHIWNDDPRDADQLGKGLGLRSFVEALEKIGDGAKFKVCVFEENANNHQLRRGLGHAHIINEIQRYEHEMPILCAANCLQPDRQNDNGWDQGLLFLNQSKVWGQSSYYVTQMISRNYQPLCVESYVDSYQESLDVTACKSQDGRVLSLRVVNLDCWDIDAQIELMDYIPAHSEALVVQIKGNPQDTNTAENPKRIVPVEGTIQIQNKNDRIQYAFPAYSFTIINFQ